MKPTKLKVVGKKINVKYVDDLIKEDETDGEYSESTGSIKIDSSLKDNKLFAALLHEMGHALFDRVSIKQGIQSQAEEIIVDTYAKVILENFTLKVKR